MVVCLFLDTVDAQHFTAETRCVVQEICDRAEIEVRALLPSLPEHIEVAAQTGKCVIQQTGDMGTAVSPERVVWIVDGSRKGKVVGVAPRHLCPTLFHEFHHLARGWVKSNYNHTPSIIDAAISEGLATAFERDFGGREAPWASYPTDAARWLEELLALPPNANYSDWMFHHPDGRSWIGYRAGTFVTDHAMAASGRSSAELVATSSTELLHMAGFTVPA
ncbi:MAG: DUF2268 domain-containing putative Zn-dependent protease [Gammaproteobacteria bacterium]